MRKFLPQLIADLEIRTEFDYLLSLTEVLDFFRLLIGLVIYIEFLSPNQSLFKEEICLPGQLVNYFLCSDYIWAGIVTEYKIYVR